MKRTRSNPKRSKETKWDGRPMKLHPTTARAMGEYADSDDCGRTVKKAKLDITPKGQPVLITTKLRRQRDQLLAAINGHPTSRTYTDNDPVIERSVTKAMQHRQAVEDAGRVVRSILDLTTSNDEG